MVDIKGMVDGFLRSMRYYGTNLKKLWDGIGDVFNELFDIEDQIYLNTFIGTDNTDGCEDDLLNDRFKFIVEQGNLPADLYREVLTAVADIRLDGFTVNNIKNLMALFTTDGDTANVEVYRNGVSGQYANEPDFTSWEIGSSIIGSSAIVGQFLKAHNFIEITVEKADLDDRDEADRILLEISPVYACVFVVYNEGIASPGDPMFVKNFSYIYANHIERYVAKERTGGATACSWTGALNIFDFQSNTFGKVEVKSSVGSLLGANSELFTLGTNDTIVIETATGTDSLILGIGPGPGFSALDIVTDLNIFAVHSIFEVYGTISPKVRVRSASNNDIGYAKADSGTLLPIIGIGIGDEDDTDVYYTNCTLTYTWTNTDWINYAELYRFQDEFGVNYVSDTDGFTQVGFKGGATLRIPISKSMQGKEKEIYDGYVVAQPVITTTFAGQYIFPSDTEFIMRVRYKSAAIIESIIIPAGAYSARTIVGVINSLASYIQAFRVTNEDIGITAVDAIEVEILESPANAILGYVTGQLGHAEARIDVDSVSLWLSGMRAHYFEDESEVIDNSATFDANNTVAKRLSTGETALAYTDGPDNIYYAESLNGVWMISSIGFTASDISMFVDGQDNIMIVGVDSPGTSLTYYYYDGVSWSSDAIGAFPGNTVSNPIVFLDGGGQVVAGFTINDGTKQVVMVAKNILGAWTNYVVYDAVTENAGGDLDYAIDQDFNLYLVGVTTNTGEVLLHKSEDAGETWVTTIILDAGYNADYNRVSVFGDEIYVAIMDGTVGLLLRWFKDGMWQTVEVVDSGASGHIDLGVDLLGVVGIVNANTSSGYIEIAYGAPGAWSNGVIGSSLAAPGNLSVIFDDFYNPNVFYFDSLSYISRYLWVIGVKDRWLNYQMDEFICYNKRKIRRGEYL